MKKNMLFVTIGIVVALVAALGVSAVFAQSDGGERPDSEVKDAIHEAVHTAIADALNMSVEDLEAAKEDGQRLPEIAEAQGVEIETVKAAAEAAKEEAVNQAVADGTLTQEQADHILSGEGRGGRGGRSGKFGGNSEALADALGMTVEELQAAKDEGLTLEEIAEQQGTTIEDVRAAMQSAKEEAINQAVADGTLTQEQADSILSGEGRGGRGGRGSGNGAGNGQPTFFLGGQNA